VGRELQQFLAVTMRRLLWGVLGSVASIAGAQVPSAASTMLAWPAPPAEPAVKYVRTVVSAGDWGVDGGFLGQVIDALTGREGERFVRPTGVAVANGVLYVADPGAPALWIVDAPQNRLIKVDRVGDMALASPVAVALGPEGSVFVADSVRKKVFRLDRAGALIGTAIGSGLERPAGLAFDAGTGRLYVADSVAHRIRIYGPDGAPIRTFGERGTADSEFNAPTHLALDRSGVLLVTDALNYRVQAFDRDCRFLWKIGRQGDGSGDFAAPKGVAADSRGHVYVVDALFDAVQVFDGRGGNLLFGFGDHGAREGQFWLPGGLFIGPDDEIYVADSYNRRIEVFRTAPSGRREGGK